MEKTKLFIKEIGDTLKRPVVSMLPGHLSFSFVLSFIPMLSLIGLIAYNLSISIEVLRDFIISTFPGETGEILNRFLSRDGIYFDGVIFTLLAISISSNGMYSVIRVANVLYGIVEDSFISKIKNRIKSILMAFLMVVLVIFMFIVLGWGNSIMNLIIELEPFDNMSNGIEMIYKIIKFPISFFVIYFIIKIIYTLAPNENIKSKSVSWGSLFTTILLIIVTIIYSLYISLTHRYDILYGSLSNIIILLMWLYFISSIFIIGLIINVNNSKRMNEEKRGENENQKNTK